VIDGSVDIWVTHLDEVAGEMDRLRGLLDRMEMDRAARFRSEPARRHFSARRAIRRLLLGRYLGQPPQDIVFLDAPGLKPQIEGFRLRELHFNESASAALAVFAIGHGMELGIDVERIRPVPDAPGIVRRFGSASEAADFRVLQEEDRDAAFLRWWTAKEAFVKMIGSGLDHPLDAFSVSFPLLNDAPTLPSPASGGGDYEVPAPASGGGDYELRLLEVGGSRDAANRFSLTELAPAPGYVGALVVAGRPSRIRQRVWSPDGRIDARGAA
jgi:4'-phosphopantetheinyl transferase